MQETLFIRFHEIILIIYLISILCYFIDFVKKSHKIRVSVFLPNVIGFILLMMNTFQPEHYSTNVQRIAVINELLLVHIGLAVLSYALFALAFVNSLLYIIQYRNLREKKF